MLVASYDLTLSGPDAAPGPVPIKEKPAEQTETQNKGINIIQAYPQS